MRDGYGRGRHRKAMTQAALEGVNQYSSRIEPWTTDMTNQVYNPSRRASQMAPMDRERCLIYGFTLESDFFPLAVHIYWGMVEGLSTRDVVDVLLTAYMYGGVQRWTLACTQLQELQLFLDELLTAVLIPKTGGTSVPFVEIGDRQIRGYNPSMLQRLLKPS